MANRILLIEDDADIAHLVELHLKDAGFEVMTEHDGDRGLARATSDSFDLLILDLMLPGTSGLDICKTIRKDNKTLPILILTSRSSEYERVLGLDLGADDYLTKPFSIIELTARVKALLRRTEALQEQKDSEQLAEVRAHDLVIEPEKRRVTRNGEELALTAREFDLLAHFARHPGIVFSRTQLLNSVWGYGYEGYEHTVNSHINRLRAKIEKDPGRPVYILTVRGAGYKFREN